MTTRRILRVHKALMLWIPPPGVMCWVECNSKLGEIWLTLVYGQEYCTAQVCAEDPRIAVGRASEWAAELLRDAHADEAAEPLPDWLGCAYDALRHVAQHAPCVVGVVDYAALLLRSIEADSFPEPTVTGTAEGGIELWWEYDGRRLIVQVQGPGRIVVQQQVGGEWGRLLVTGRYCYPAFLAAAEWLRPGHVGPVDRSLWERPVRARIDCGGDK